MKTFFDLIEEVQKPGRCHRCGGCVAFCTALNYGALELDEEGRPRFKDVEKCVAGGLCYSICPETHELDEDVKKLVAWEPPMGRVLAASVVRTMNPAILAQATDGGVVTALLLHLFDKGHIDGAIVTKKAGSFQRKPWLASTREEILESAGFHFDGSHGLALFSELYSTYAPSMVKLGFMGAKRMNRVAFVGTPCQVNTIRRIQALGIEPANAIKFIFGLYCTGNFTFGPEQRQRLEEIGRFQWNDVEKINVKEQLMIHLKNQEKRNISLDQLDFMKRPACHFCADYTAEFADLSFGGLGAPEGWTTVITRSARGQDLLADAVGKSIEMFTPTNDHHMVLEALAKARELSDKKKQSAKTYRMR
jgi:coenzyme F420 hydrogenase subunit beta